jgi:hypothetical protein
MLVPNELGVRLLFTLMGTSSIYFIYLMIEERSNTSLFILSVTSIILVHIHFAGFFALPDIPLVFFSCIFLLVYKKYIFQEKIWHIPVLALLAAAMFYSKYHALIIIFFVVLSNLELFKKRSFYIIIFLTAAFLVPHLLWQIENKFPTFAYHLISRGAPYKFEFTFSYLGSTILVLGPFTGLFLLFGSFKVKAKNKFNRAMKFLLFGYLIFFLLMSFKGRVEAHWVAASIIPLTVLGVNYYRLNKKGRRLLYAFSLPTLVLFLLFRIVIATDFVIDRFELKSELHHWDDWAEEIKSVAKDRPVVFTNWFQYPSKYTFYTKNFSTSLNTVDYRKNQYNIWEFEKKLQGNEVMYIGSATPEGRFPSSVRNTIRYEIIPNFRSYYNSVKVSFPENKISSHVTDSIPVTFFIENITADTIDFNANLYMKPFVHLTMFLEGKIVGKQKLDVTLNQLAPYEKIKYNSKIMLPPIEGKYKAYIGLATKNLRPALNGGPLKISIE